MPPGIASQQQHSVLQHLADPERVAGDRLRAMPKRPAAAGGAVASVRVRHDAVQGNELGDDDAHDGSPSSQCSPVFTGRTCRTHRGGPNSSEEIRSGRSNALNTRKSANTTLRVTRSPMMVKT